MIYWSAALALLWTALQGKFTIANLIGGFILGFLVLAFMSPFYRGRAPVTWSFPKLVPLFTFFLRELLVSNVRVIRACLSRNPDLHPRILMIPLEATHDTEISILANLVSLTPGTLSLHVSEDRGELYVHSLFGASEDVAGTIEGVKMFEKRVMEASR